MATTRYFAIRIGTVIEIRSGKRPPMALISKFRKPLGTSSIKYKYIDEAPFYVKQVVPDVLELKQIYYVGGKVRALVAVSNFSRHAANFKITTPKPDAIIEIPEACYRSIPRVWRV